MKKGILIGMGSAFTIAGCVGYMLYKNMDHDTKRGVGRAIERKARKTLDKLDCME
jgi:hypothetical protein